MDYQLLEMFVAALSVTVVLISLLQAHADRIQLQDIPDARKIHTKPIPRTGGIGIVLGSLTALFLAWPFDKPTFGLLAGGVVIFLFGLADDRLDLHYKWKFLGQILAAGVVVVLGGIRLRYLPFFSDIELVSAIGIPITVFVLLGIINAINLADGLDGLAGGTVLLSFFVVAALGYRTGQYPTVLASMALIGSTSGFLRYNTYPATIFMGDAGSQFLGLMLGSLTIQLAHAENAALSAILPLLLVGLPILDTLWVMVQRISEGRSPFKADKNHLHHRLLEVGLNHSEAVLVIYLLQSLLVTFAYFACFQSDLLLVGFYTGLCGCLVGLLIFFDDRTVRQSAVVKRITGRMGRLRRFEWNHGRLEDIVTLVLFLGMLGYIGFSLALADYPDFALTVFCLVLAGFTASMMLIREWKSSGTIEQILVYITITALVYWNQKSLVPAGNEGEVVNALFVILALFVALGFRFCDKLRFRLTPLDFLTMFFAFALPVYAHEDGSGDAENFGIAVAKMCTLFYTAEIVIANYSPTVLVLRVGTFVVLSAVCARALLGC